VISKKRILAILCMLVTAGLLVAGLWPFDLSPKNRAYWLPDEEGLHFDGQRDRWKLSVGGIAYTPSPLRSLKPAPLEMGSFTVDIFLKPVQDSRDGVPHILSFIDHSGKEVLYAGQWKQSLIVRWFSFDKGGTQGMREIGVGDALAKGKTKRLTIVSGQESTSIYRDGELAKHFQGTSLISEKESIRGYSVALGNSRNVKSSWTGSILGLRLYDRGLVEDEVAKAPAEAGKPLEVRDEGLIAAFAFDKARGTLIPDLSGNENSLEVPERVTLTNDILAWSDWNVRKRASLTEDMIVNVLGFVPFGFLLSFWREQTNGSSRWRSYVFAILMGALISLGIEVAQAFIPARDSSMVDLLCNTGGTGIGVLTLALFVR